jgi:hypothetical protein
MPLQRGEVQGYGFDRMIVEFTMLNQGKVVPCAISTAAMDDLEGRRSICCGSSSVARSATAARTSAEWSVDWKTASARLPRK